MQTIAKVFTITHQISLNQEIRHLGFHTTLADIPSFDNLLEIIQEMVSQRFCN